MSVIKKSSAPKPSVKKAPPKPPAPKTESAKKPTETKAESKTAETKPLEVKDPQTRKPETAETKPGEKPGETKPNSEAGQVDENGKPIEDPNKPEESKDPEDRFEGSQELNEEDPEKEELREELQSLKDALAALFDQMGSEDEDKKEAASESPGGCCGKPSGAKQAGDSEGNQDWNAILAAGIAAVKAQGLGQPAAAQNGATGGQGRQNGQNGQNPIGQVGANGNSSAGGRLQVAGGQAKPNASGNAAALGGKQGADPLTKLASDYQKAKSSGAELKPEIENEVRSLLGLPAEDKGGAQAGGSNAVNGLAMAS